MQTAKNNVPLGDYVRKRRESRGLSYYEAAEASDLDHTYWRKLEAGHYASPRPHVLQAIAGVIDAPLSDLYALAGYPSAEDLPGFAPYLRGKYHLPAEAIEQLEGYFSFLRNQYGIDKNTPVFPPRPKKADKGKKAAPR